MSNPIPNQLALTSIADGSQRLAAPIRNNYSAIQTAVNALITALSGGSVGQYLEAADSSDVEWAYPPGHELYYAEATSPVSVTGTTEGAATSIFAGASTAYDGTAVWLEVWFPYFLVSDTTDSITLAFFDGSTSLGQARIGIDPAANSGDSAVSVRRKITPSVANHTFNVQAFKTGGTATLGAGAGGSGAFLPAYFRVVKA